MGREITTTTAPRTLSLREAEAKIEAFHGSLEAHPSHPTRFCVRHSQAPTIDERRQLGAVLDRLEQRLEPCRDNLAIEALVSQFLIGFEHGKGASDLNTASLNERYVKALHGLPLGAIAAAIARYDSAKTLLPWNCSFRPNPAEFTAEVREGLIPIRTRLLRVRRVLDAEVYEPPSEADRAKVDAEMKRFIEQRHAFDVERAQAEPTAAEVELARRGETAKAAAELREAADPQTIGRLMANLDAKRVRRTERAPA
ncbi:hypothetical protein [Methylobacterium organophilum]|uniref:Uncharacterized protein n=1 Tax=Methylobacterium organophilum TaxID=410 RepID=A0ABQ4TEW6_METOR|nr:hypothetical protein [Methylobacterium organophilum]GJE29753.1 hypothetical protein LKMONMHP_4639 [Methylobacterium organophilum]